MAKSDSVFKDVLGIGAFLIVAYIVIRYVLPSLTSGLNSGSGGLFGSSANQNPFGFSFTNSPYGSTTRFSTSGSLSQLIAALTGQQKQQQPSAGKPSAGGGFGGGQGGGLLPAVPNPGGLSLTSLQDFSASGNQSLSDYFSNPLNSPSSAYYDTSGLDSIQIPGGGTYTPTQFVLPDVPYTSGGGGGDNNNLSLAGDAGNLYDPSLDNYTIDG